MTGFRPAHKCEIVRGCTTPAMCFALFRGSLSLACPDHAAVVHREYNAQLYNSAGQEVSP